MIRLNDHKEREHQRQIKKKKYILQQKKLQIGEAVTLHLIEAPPLPQALY